MTIEDKQKVEVNLQKESEQQGVSLKLKTKVQVKAKKISDAAAVNNSLNVKRERVDSQQNEKVSSPTIQKKIKPSEENSNIPSAIVNKTETNQVKKNDTQKLAAVLGYSSSSDSE